MHKDYVLPDVDLSHDEGDPKWHAAGGKSTSPIYDDDGEIRLYSWNGLEPGHYREYWRLCVEESWASVIANYEREPDDVYHAYLYVDDHPVFWAFLTNRHSPEYPANHVSNLEHEGALMHRHWPEVIPHKYENEIIWCYEFGKRDLFPDEHGHHVTWFDHELAGHGETYEQAIIRMARVIWENYGNDRQVVDSERWERGDGSGHHGEAEKEKREQAG